MDYKAGRRIYIPDGKMPSIGMRNVFKRGKFPSPKGWQFYKRWVNRKTRYAERDEINKGVLT